MSLNVVSQGVLGTKVAGIWLQYIASDNGEGASVTWRSALIDHSQLAWRLCEGA